MSKGLEKVDQRQRAYADKERIAATAYNHLSLENENVVSTGDGLLASSLVRLYCDVLVKAEAIYVTKESIRRYQASGRRRV